MLKNTVSIDVLVSLKIIIILF